MTADATLTLNGQTLAPQGIPLRQGWNMVGFPSQTERDMATLLTGISDHINVVWYYDASDPASPWKRHVPSGPPWGNTLGQFTPTQGYWMQVSEACTLTIP
jgi:hypothetical protein